MIELRSGVIVAVVAATAFAQTGAEPSEAFDLRTHVRRDDACRVTLNRVVGGKLKIEGAKPPIVDFDEKTDESWVDHRSHDSGAQQYDDRRVILDARTTRLGRIADSGDAGMTLLWAMRAGTPGLYPDRNVLGRKDRLLTQRDFAHLRLALPSEARIGDAFDVDPIALVATTASLRGASREATLRLTAKSRNAKTGLVRLEGPLTFFEDLAVGGGATTLKHVLGVAVDFDPARGAAASITLKGKATPVAASGGKVTATGELSIATSLTSQRMPDAATWKPPAPTFRDNVHRACGLEFKLPSYFAATGDGDYEHVDVRTLNAVSPTFHMISFEERRPIQDDGFIEANAEGFKTTPAAFKPCKTPLGPGLALRTEPDGARGRRLVRFLQTSGRVVRISILTGGGNSADLEAVLDRLIASLKSAP